MSGLYIKDYNMSCHLGDDKELVRNNLFNSDFQVNVTKVELNSGRSTVFFPISGELSDLPEKYSNYNSRNNQLALSVLKKLQPAVSEIKQLYGSKRVAVVTATSTTGIDNFEKAMISENSNLSSKSFNMDLQEVGNLNLFVSEYFSLGPISFGISTACSSGGKIFAEAQRLIDADLCDAVVVGGCDTLCGLTLNGFDSLSATSECTCLPFSENRSGINIGEGAAFFVLSKEPSDHRILGVGESSDAYHISSPEPDGVGAELAIRAALKQAGIEAQEISYINLHGTATKKNDLMEAKLISRIFGDKVPVSSTKPLVGHTLGAAGAIELGLCVMVINESKTSKKLPVQRSDGKWDPELPKLNFVGDSEFSSGSIIMSNSFAFGGSNVSVIVGGV